MPRTEALMAVASGVLVGPFLCLVLTTTEAVEILSRGTAAMLIVAFSLLALSAAFHRVAAPPGVLRRFAHADAFQRWADHRCPSCGHAMPPHRFNGLCPECGEPFRVPKLTPRSRRESLRFASIAIAIAITLALGWLVADVATFRAEAARSLAQQPGQPVSRPRWWPGGYGQFVATGAIEDGRLKVIAHE
jgi:hypothetical protein